MSEKFRYNPRAGRNDRGPGQLALSVLSPCDPDQDIGRNSYRIMDVKRAFAAAATSLELRLDAFEVGE